jgi:hypothetical protein
VVLFGPVAPAWWGPPPGRDQHVALWREVDRDRPADPHADHLDPALALISVEDVLAAARSILG